MSFHIEWERLAAQENARQLSSLVGAQAVVLTGDDLTRIDPDSTGGSEELANAQAMAGSTTGLAVCVAVFVVATFALAAEQHRRELALLRLVGAAPKQVRRMVLGETLLIGWPRRPSAACSRRWAPYRCAPGCSTTTWHPRGSPSPSTSCRC
ncbi:MAG: transporter permease [Actinomycetia bacterium]|nr:transporter permease [Actinomycetes bacterium]